MGLPSLDDGANIAEGALGRYDNIVHIHAMVHRVVFIAFDGFQLLDVTGPAAVYGMANDDLGRACYEVKVIAAHAPSVRSSAPVEIACIAPASLSPSEVDSVFVVGGEESALRTFIADVSLQSWVIEAQKTAKRFGSVCSGSVALAAWGLTGSKRFASHWAAAPEIKSRWPALNLDAESIFVEDGALWTSAGVTTGIDMTLDIVERDHGPALARRIAQRLVLSVRRPGWQSQFSPALAAQGGSDDRYRDLIAWLATTLDAPIGVEDMAARSGETLRSFHRNFARITGMPPAAYLARHRLDHARGLIEQGMALKSVAAKAGYRDVARLSAAFQRAFGMSATAYRLVHGPG
jgi:transcriptional regulator GlxA family with amidase domain